MKYVILVVFIFVSTAVSNAQEKSGNGDRVYILHNVQQGETIFSISKKYAIEQRDLLSANPGLIMGMKTGQKLKIPVGRKNVERMKAAPVTRADQDATGQGRLPSFEEYKVKKDDSLYFIAKLFGIEVEDIVTYNPEVREGLSRGQILKIPDKDDLAEIRIQQEASQPVPEQSEASTGNDAGPVAEEAKLPCEPDIRAVRQTYRIGLLLDFYLPANDTINRERVTLEEMMRDSLLVNRAGGIEKLPLDSFKRRDDVAVYSRSENFIHFYEGVLLAADSMKRAGMDIQLHVYDTNQKQYIVDSLIRSGSLKGLDLIIGPTFPELQRKLADFALKNRIPMISPLSSSGNFEMQNPWYFKVNPTKQYLIDKTADYIAKEHFDKNLIVLRTGEYGNFPGAELVGLLREKLMYSASQPDKVHLREYRLSSETEGLKALLSKDRENVFIISSEAEAQVSVAVTNLNALAEEYPVTLVGLSGYNRYRSIQTEYFHRIKLTYLTPYFVDYGSVEVNRFIRKFRLNFAGEPNPYSFQGYDVSFYFMTALFRYGKEFTPCLPMLRVSLTQSELAFDKAGADGGYMNRGLFIVQYQPDFDIIIKGITGTPFNGYIQQ